MKEAEIKRKIELLNEMTISRVDYHFNEYVLTDILDCGQVEYLIDNESWLLYWLDVAHDLNNLLNELISAWHAGKIESRNDLLECVRIKGIIDRKLQENPKFNKSEVFEDLDFDIARERQSNHIALIGSDEFKQRFISELYKLLTENGYIDLPICDFRLHFLKHYDSESKIKWLGTEVQIVGLFNQFIIKGMIAKSYLYSYPKLIVAHFINRNSKEFKEKQLSVVKSNLKEDSYSQIVGLINKLSINDN